MSSDISYEVEDPGKVISASFDPSLSYDPETSNVWKVPKPKFAPRYFIKHDRQFEGLMNETEILVLKKYISDKFELIKSAENVQKILGQLITKFSLSDIQVSPDTDPLVMLKYMEDILEHYHRRIQMFDISLEGCELLEGTTLQLKIDESTKKVSELLESYQQKLNEAEQNVWNLHEIIDENSKLIRTYEDRIAHLYNQILALKGSFGKTVDEKPDETNFFRELRKHLENDLHLNSSFKEELAAEKRTKHSLFQEICRLKELRVYDEQHKMKEIAEIAKDMELEEGIKHGILEKIQTLTAKPEEINKAVNNWMKEIESVIGPKEERIRFLKDSIKSLESQISQDAHLYQDIKSQYRQLTDAMVEMDDEINEKLKIFDAKQEQINNLDKAIEESLAKYESLSSSTTQYYDASSSPFSMRGSPETSPKTYGISSGSESLTPDSSFRRSPSTLHSDVQSPEFVGTSSFVGMSHSTPQSGIYPSNRRDESGSLSFSFDESPEKFRRGSPFRGVTNFDDSSPMSIHSTPRSALPSYSASPSSPFHMPSPSPLLESFAESGVMVPGTVAIPGPSTKFPPTVPEIYPSSPTCVSNRFEIGKSLSMHAVCQTSTPYRQVTRVQSFIPESGYSGHLINHPLSIGHSSAITPECVTPFISKSRFGYTNPTARVLNIPPVFETPIRNLSSTQEGQNLSPDVVTYGTAPAVTPTTTRRYGLFTPKSTFQKKHFNLRRLYDPDCYESPELPWSPQYLPLESRSPMTPFRTSPVMNRTFDANTTYVNDRAFGESSPGTYDASYVPFDASSPQGINRTFDASSPYAMNRTFDASSPYAMNRTFDASPLVMNQTFNTSPAYAMPNTLPSPFDGTFNLGSPSPSKNVTFDLDRTYGETQPKVLNTTFGSISSPFNRNLDNRAMRDLNATFNRTLDRTFKRNTSPGLNKTI